VVRTFALTEGNRAAVVRICRRLDGLPLAIELAAARVNVLPPEQLANRLDDVFSILTTGARTTLPRHRTLRALIDWSYGLLSDQERQLFERLAIFAGGFTLESAEAVVAFGCLARGDVLGLLAGLVDKSLVTMQERAGQARYTMLETVRQYADERLRGRDADDRRAEGDRAPNDGGVAVLARRHALHYLELAEQAAAQLHHAAQLEWLARLDAEHDNLRAALRWSLTAGELELAMRLCVALRDFWRMRGHLTEGLLWMEEALRASAGGGAPDVLRARALVGAGVLARRLGNHEVFRARVVEGEALARTIGDATALADALTQRGVHLRDLGEPAGARALLEEAISLWRAKGDAWGLTLALCARSAIAHAEGDLPLARALRLEAVEVSRRVGDREGEAFALVGLGELARGEGDTDAARAYYARSMTFFRELGDTWHVSAILHNQGWVAAESGEYEEARQSFAAALALFDSERALILAPCLAGLARLLAETGDPESAAVAFGSATAFAERERMLPARADALSIERTRLVIEAALGQEAFARASALGAASAPAEHVRRALNQLERGRAEQGLAPEEGAAASKASLDGNIAPARTRPAVEDALPAALRVAALGPLEILVDGVAIDIESFGSRKARELLLLLLCCADGCTREQVGLAFWPDASAAEVKNRFHVTLHRLRKALGHPEWIASSEERYRIAPEVRVDFDAARFETEVVAALRAMRTGTCAPERLGAALALYRGDFLEHEGVGDWHLEVRDRLRRLCVDGHLAQGELLMRADRFTDAAAVYRSLLVHDALHEQGCRRLMECYARTGQRTEALRHYERFALLLRDELDAEPDAETTALYERLQQGAAR
jgi:DNA-binding SARP family transcriptional activator